MAKSVLERCDYVVGEKENFDYFAAVGSYKDGEETKYAVGAYLSVPAKFKTEDADINKALLLWCKRMASADNAGIPAKIKAGDITIEEAASAIMSYNGENFLERLNETKTRREGGAVKVDSTETLAIRKLAAILRAKNADGNVPADFPRAADPPLTEKGIVNYNAWAKVAKAEGHKWYATALKLVSSDKGFD
jgi:hypothetical protein